MPRPLDVFAAALRALEAGKGVAVAAVIGARGSTPRHLGARMSSRTRNRSRVVRRRGSCANT